MNQLTEMRLNNMSLRGDHGLQVSLTRQELEFLSAVMHRDHKRCLRAQSTIAKFKVTLKWVDSAAEQKQRLIMHEILHNKLESAILAE